MTVLQLVLICEVIMYYVNKRPIGMSSTLESVRPADILPVWSKVNPSVSMTGCTQVVESAKQEFLERWNQLYKFEHTKTGEVVHFEPQSGSWRYRFGHRSID